MISLILLKLFTFSQILQGVPKLSHATVYKKKKNAGQRAKLAARPPGILPVLPMASPPLSIYIQFTVLGQCFVSVKH